MGVSLLVLFTQCVSIPLHFEESSFISALAANPKDFRVRLQYGTWLSEQQRHLEAEVETRAAVNAVPGNSAYRKTLAELLATSGDRGRARDEFLEGLRRTENDWTLREAYAKFLLEHDVTSAVKEFVTAAQFTHNAAKASLLLQAAEASEASGKPVGDLYSRAVEADRNADTLFSHAQYLRHVQRNYREAEEAYRSALALDPAHFKTLLAFATFLHRNRNDPAAARPYFERAVEFEDCRAWDAYAQFLRDRGEYVKMAKYARRAAEDPRFDTSWRGLSVWDPSNLPQSVFGCPLADVAQTLACSMLILSQHLRDFVAETRR